MESSNELAGKDKQEIFAFMARKPWLNDLRVIDVNPRRVPFTVMYAQVPEWCVLKELTYEVRGHTIVIPQGFETDLASVPAIIWWYYAPWGPYAPDAVVHDFCYERRLFDRKECDLIYYELLKRNPLVSTATAWTHYSAVRAGGYRAYVTD